MFHYFVGAILFALIIFYLLKFFKQNDKKGGNGSGNRNTSVAAVVFVIILAVCLVYWLTSGKNGEAPSLIDSGSKNANANYTASYSGGDVSILSQIPNSENVIVGLPPF